MEHDPTLTSWDDLQHELQPLVDLLAGHDDGQLVLFEVDDCLSAGHLVPCPLRGTHLRLTDCWACWCDVTRGHVTADQVLRT